MRKKKVIGLAMAATLIAGMLAGCGGGGATTAAPSPEATTAASDDTQAKTDDGKELYVYLVSKGFQHQFWQAVYKGAQEKAEELGVKMEMQGPNTESDIQQQVQMLNNAINQKPDALGLAALDTKACLPSIEEAQKQNIPIIGFDSGVPDAPKGAIFANAATDNYAAGELAAEETYKLIKEKIASADKPVRIGVMGQDATSDSIVSRGLGFIDKMIELVKADGKTTTVEGNDKYVEGHDKNKDADVIFDVAVPAQVTAEASTIDGQNLMNKADTICIYASNQHSGEALVHANDNLKKLGPDGTIVGIAFDSGTVIKTAVKDKTLAGAVTQDPMSIGRNTVELAVKAAKGEAVEDVDTGCQWFTSENMDDPSIAPNLYD